MTRDQMTKLTTAVAVVCAVLLLFIWGGFWPSSSGELAPVVDDSEQQSVDEELVSVVPPEKPVRVIDEVILPSVSAVVDSGRVVIVTDASSGLPVNGALIALDQRGVLREVGPSVEGRLDLSGVQMEGNFFGYVSAPEYGALPLRLSLPLAKDRHVQLERGHATKFIHRAGAEPVSAPITLHIFDRTNHVFGGTPGSALRSINAREFVLPESGELIVFFESGHHDAFASCFGVDLFETSIRVPGTEEVVVVLDDRATVRARVRDRSTKLALAGVALAPAYFRGLPANCVSDANGEVLLEVNKRGRSAWVARLEGYQDELATVFPTKTYDGGVLNIDMAPVCEISGDLVGFGSDVRVRSIGTVERLARPDVVHGTVTGDTFSVRVRSREACLLYLHDNEGNWATVYVRDRALTGGQLALGTIVAERGLTVAGRLDYPRELGVEAPLSIQVVIYREVGRRGREVRQILVDRRIALDAGGQFKATGLPAGTMELRGTLGGGVCLLEKGTLDQSQMALKLFFGGTISGVLRAGNGEPVAFADIWASRCEGHGRQRTESDASGFFVLIGLDENANYNLRIYSEDQSTQMDQVASGSTGLKVLVR